MSPQTGVLAMTANYAFESRVLLCGHCGAPLQVSTVGGAVRCSYCGTASQLSARAALPTFGSTTAAELSEPRRIANLRAQLGRAAAAPTTLAPLLEGESIPAWREKEAFSVWQSSRRRAAQGDLNAAEEVVFLTERLSRVQVEGDQALRQRAMLQSGLESLTLPRHRQRLAAALARGAAREGDLTGAERWLALCDPLAEDLLADSAYRIARSLVETMHHHHSDVLHVLGDKDAVPIIDEHLVLSQVLRGNALAGIGRRDDAVALLALGNVEVLRMMAQRYLAVGIDMSLLDAALTMQRSRGAAHWVASNEARQQQRHRQRQSTRKVVATGAALAIAVVLLVLAVRCSF